VFELLLELVHPFAQLGEREAERLVLALVPAGAEPELDATAGDVVCSRHHLRQLAGAAKGDRRDERPEPEALGHGGKRGDRRPGIQRDARRILEDGLVVVGAEERFDPALLAGARKRQPVLPGDAFLAFDHQGNPHRVSSATDSTCGVCGNMSTGLTRRSVYPHSSTSSFRFPASVVGLQET
jgi:hypothetical protein